MGTESLINDLGSAIRNRSTFPVMPDNLSLDEAYAIQKQVVESISDGPVAGWKAGMTAPAGQAAFGLTHPLIGFLYQWGQLDNGASIPGISGLKLECEIGIVIDGNGNPKSAGPVIEVPRMAWGTPDDAKGSNLTATNIAADRFIVGEQQAVRDDYAELEVTLTRNGNEVVCQAPLSDALGGPKDALAWMLEEANVRGMTLAEDMLLITGACGGIHDAEAGSYVADYGPLGTVEFTIT